MTEENQNTECKCLCQNKYFKNFIVVTAGTFTGVTLALCLFTALHKPPMPIPPAPHMMVPPPAYQMQFAPQPGHFDKHKPHHHKMPPKDFHKNTPDKK